MPVYYNPSIYNNPNPNVGAAYFNAYPQQTLQQQFPMNSVSYGMPSNNYWISVDGEMAARAWQMPQNVPPNTIIPLWDLDGQHVYFKSTDAYGRINPIRKGKVVFEEDMANLPAGQSEGCSGASAASVNMPSGRNPVYDSAASTPDMSGYVTKEDFDGLRHEIQEMLRNQRELAQASVNAISTEAAPQQNPASNDVSVQPKGFTNNQNGNQNKPYDKNRR